MNQKMHILFALVMLVSVVGFASGTKKENEKIPMIDEKCDPTDFISKDITVFKTQYTGIGCNITVDTQAKPDFVYRNYWMDNRGRFLVYNSVSGDDLSKNTGARVYFFFPRRYPMGFKVLTSGDVEVSMSNGGKAVFNSKTARLVSFPNEFSEDPNVSLDNNGGVEIKAGPGLVLDTGWRIDKYSYTDPKRKSVFTDSKGHQCEIQNDEFFYYESMYYGEPNLKYPDDASLLGFMRERCPQLDAGSLDY